MLVTFTDDVLTLITTSITKTDEWAGNYGGGKYTKTKQATILTTKTTLRTITLPSEPVPIPTSNPDEPRYIVFESDVKGWTLGWWPLIFVAVGVVGGLFCKWILEKLLRFLWRRLRQPRARKGGKMEEGRMTGRDRVLEDGAAVEDVRDKGTF